MNTLKGKSCWKKICRESCDFFFFFLQRLHKKSRELNVTKTIKLKCRLDLKSQTAGREEKFV